MTIPAPPPAVLEAYGLTGARLVPISIGWINQTHRVEVDGRPTIVLQRLHPAFRGEVNRDIDAITRHLEAHGVPTPRIVTTRDGALWIEHEGATYRALTFLEGRVVARIDDPAIARSSAGLVARFHAAVADLEHDFHFVRPGAHDTPLHLARLRAAIASVPEGASAVLPIAEEILEYARTLAPLPATRTRIIHGDLKITNVLLEPEGTGATALLDLDTLAHGTIAVELGDLLRSWCNRDGEATVGATADETIFSAAIEGYAATGPILDRDEIGSIVLGFETIAMELSARFALDVIEDRYFGWDATRWPSRRAHNLARAHTQLGLARSVRQARPRLEAIVARAFDLR
jgi:Ser/Thr protein kinase RdoA (MazF antagonist)